MSLDILHQTLLRMEPEAAHDAAMRGLRLLQFIGLPLRLMRRRYVVNDRRLEQQQWNQRFTNPIGLAAGFDKNGQAIGSLAALGFGYLEVGTVTPKPQAGNPKPRVFRHPSERSLQNALGFNNAGGAAMQKALSRQLPFPLPVGINIGKNRMTAPERALQDYVGLVDRLAGLADYLVINVSSPNTPGLRDLQEREVLATLVRSACDKTAKPILVKFAPDLEDSRAVELAGTAIDAGASGIVVTNTTVDYSLLPGIRPVGGLSGHVLQRRSREMIQILGRELGDRCTLISVGGIDSAAEAYTRIRAGASLIQVYTAMVFEGPLLIRRLLEGLLEILEREGVGSITEVVGADR